MQRRVHPVLVPILLILTFVGTARASVVTSMNDQTLVRLSPIIVHGTVVSVSVVANEDDGSIHTDVRLSVTEMFRGPEHASDVTVRLLGGRHGSREARVFGTPRFLAGEEVVVFARPTKRGWLTVTGLFQGKISIERTPAGAAFAVRSTVVSDGPVVVVPRGAPEPARAPLSTWLAELRRLVDQQRSIETTPAEPREPSAASFTDNVVETPNFTLLAIPIRRFEPDSGVPVLYFYNPTNAPPVPGGARPAFENALEAWSTVTGASIIPQDGGDTGAECFLTFDGVSGISHADPCGEVPAFDTSTCSGVLAIGGLSEIALFETKTVNGVSFLRGTQGDVVLNDGADCFWSAPGNYEEVMTHEIGHTMGLGHSCGDSSSPGCGTDPLLDEAQMRAFAHGDGRGASLRGDDVNGLRFIYPPPAFVELRTEETNLSTGEPLRITMNLNGTTTADLWFLLFTPAGGPLGGLAAADVPLAYAVDISVMDFTFTGSEPAGTYVALAALTIPGEAPSDPAAILSFSTVTATFAP